MSLPPILLQFQEDGTFRPAHQHVATCRRHLAVGDWHRVEIVEERSAKSHNFYFAQLNEIWMSLPEGLAADLASVEHLRKWCLIATGYSNDRHIPAPSVRVAQEIAAIARLGDEFAVVEVRGSVVVVRQAKSQSRAAMGKQMFQASKVAVLDYAAGLISTNTAAVEQNAREVA